MNLTSSQTGFLRQLQARQDMDLEQAAAQVRVSMERVRKWLTEPKFAAAFDEAQRVHHLEMGWRLQRLAGRGVKVLEELLEASDAKAGAKEDEQSAEQIARERQVRETRRRVAVDAIRLSIRMESAQRARQRARSAAADTLDAAGPSDRDCVHPDVAHRADELLHEFDVLQQRAYENVPEAGVGEGCGEGEGRPNDNGASEMAEDGEEVADKTASAGADSVATRHAARPKPIHASHGRFAHAPTPHAWAGRPCHKRCKHIASHHIPSHSIRRRSMTSRRTRRAWRRQRLFEPPRSPAALRAWVLSFCGITMPSRSVCPHHQGPLEYLWRSYREPAEDLVVWAPRGGGKTRLGALATLLDLLHKPGCSVRILGGSLEQSLRMWEHLLPDVERLGELLGRRLVAPGALKSRKVALINGSSAAVLTQSQRAVRGLRVQKLRCDEVEMFDPQVWEAAQLVTRSAPARWRGGHRGGAIAATVEALSTFHKPHGLMSRITAPDDGVSPARLLKWCLLDVLEKCPPERDCGSCPLWDECRGAAKLRGEGFFSIDDAIRLKQRVSRETWDSEMLCIRPSRRHCVFPTFDPKVHVRGELAVGGGRLEVEEGAASPSVKGGLATGSASVTLAIDFGFNAPFVCLWVEMRAGGVVWVIDEYVRERRILAEHLAEIESRRWGKVKRIACDPAGAGPNDQTAESNIALLRRRGYVVKARHSRIIDGLEQIRAALCPAYGEPRLFIHRRCGRLIAALEGYHYDEDDPGSEIPCKDGVHDHLIDALRYFYVNHPERSQVRVGRY